MSVVAPSLFTGSALFSDPCWEMVSLLPFHACTVQYCILGVHSDSAWRDFVPVIGGFVAQGDRDWRWLLYTLTMVRHSSTLSSSRQHL